MLTKVDYWMERFKDHKNEKSFELLGGIFCDGIVIHKLKIVFPTEKDLKLYLGFKGLCV